MHTLQSYLLRAESVTRLSSRRGAISAYTQSSWILPTPKQPILPLPVCNRLQIVVIPSLQTHVLENAPLVHQQIRGGVKFGDSSIVHDEDPIIVNDGVKPR